MWSRLLCWAHWIIIIDTLMPFRVQDNLIVLQGSSSTSFGGQDLILLCHLNSVIFLLNFCRQSDELLFLRRIDFVTSCCQDGMGALSHLNAFGWLPNVLSTFRPYRQAYWSLGLVIWSLFFNRGRLVVEGGESLGCLRRWTHDLFLSLIYTWRHWLKIYWIHDASFAHLSLAAWHHQALGWYLSFQSTVVAGRRCNSVQLVFFSSCFLLTISHRHFNFIDNRLRFIIRGNSWLDRWSHSCRMICVCGWKVGLILLHL